ncbi:hypothetical protein [Salisaeta longa]|uniref:hypothetical protein n=1 Tax=Salisaeta longa TaxID=503170 RepID=UPI0003FC76FE|nr:hypothetical protein [Salisaeta longa]
MDDQRLEDHILNYSALSAEDQAAVEEAVRHRPQMQALLRDVKALEALGQQAYAPATGAEAHPLLAYYVAVQFMHPGDVAPALKARFEVLEAQLATDETLQATYERYRQRAADAAEHFDRADEQFEALTGFALDDTLLDDSSDDGSPDASGDREGPAPSVAERPPEGTSKHMHLWGAPMRTVTRWAVAAVLLVGLTYGALYAIGRAQQSTAERLAAVSMQETRIEGYTTRTRSAADAAKAPTTPDARFLRALQALRSARSAPLGLFPSYDSTALRQATQDLTYVLTHTPEGSFLALEARFFLGKALLAQGKIEAARQQFKTVALLQGRRSQDAHRILRKLQAAYPAAPPSAS